MGIKAAMGYLRTLRDSRKISLVDIAHAANVQVGLVEQWERGEVEPSLSEVATFVQVVKGSISTVIQLLSENPDSDFDGEVLAHNLLEMHPNDQEVVAQFSPKQSACMVCGQTAWKIGGTVALIELDNEDRPNAINGPFRIGLQIICEGCRFILLFDTGYIHELDAITPRD